MSPIALDVGSIFVFLIGNRFQAAHVRRPTRIRSATAGESEPFLRLLFTRAPEQDDTKQERHDEWDSRDSDNKTGTGVPWRRERSRVRKLETSDHKEQQREPI